MSCLESLGAQLLVVLDTKKQFCRITDREARSPIKIVTSFHKKPAQAKFFLDSFFLQESLEVLQGFGLFFHAFFRAFVALFRLFLEGEGPAPQKGAPLALWALRA